MTRSLSAEDSWHHPTIHSFSLLPVAVHEYAVGPPVGGGPGLSLQADCPDVRATGPAKTHNR